MTVAVLAYSDMMVMVSFVKILMNVMTQMELVKYLIAILTLVVPI